MYLHVNMASRSFVLKSDEQSFECNGGHVPDEFVMPICISLLSITLY